MATSLLALLDDITSILDDVATLTKISTQKTAGVLGDDLALNAQQVTGLKADRELPVVWAVAKGSLVNKAILVPSALAISAVAPWAIIPLLMAGGLFLCYEGAEKLAHRYLHPPEKIAAKREARLEAVVNPTVDLVVLEKDKIKGAIRTDFILSAEIVVITLGTVATATFLTRVAVLVGIALLMTVGVYGLVAGIVKLDDAGLSLASTEGETSWASSRRRIGRVILRAAPILMKTLGVVGTAAMFLVGGSILMHGIPPLEHAVEGMVSGMGGFVEAIGLGAAHLVTGLLAGALTLVVVLAVQRMRKGPGEASAAH